MPRFGNISCRFLFSGHSVYPMVSFVEPRPLTSVLAFSYNLKLPFELLLQELEYDSNTNLDCAVD